MLLGLSQFNARLTEQSPEVLRRIFWLYLILPLLLWSGAAFFIWRYPLTRQRMAEIRSALEARRGNL